MKTFGIKKSWSFLANQKKVSDQKWRVKCTVPVELYILQLGHFWQKLFQ